MAPIYTSILIYNGEVHMALELAVGGGALATHEILKKAHSELGIITKEEARIIHHEFKSAPEMIDQPSVWKKEFNVSGKIFIILVIRTDVSGK